MAIRAGACLVLVLLAGPAAWPAETITSGGLAATFQDGVLVAARNLLTGERYFTASPPQALVGITERSGLLPAGQVVQRQRLPDGYCWEAVTAGPNPARVLTTARRGGQGEIIVEQQVVRPRGGIGGVAWGWQGLDPSARLVIPAAGGVVVDPARSEQEISYEYPGSWQAAALFVQGPRGGLWLWTDDPRRHFKDLSYRRQQGVVSLRFGTQSDGPAAAYRTFRSVTWRLCAYRGDWRVPAARYRDLMARSCGLAPLARRQPAWVREIRFVVRIQEPLSATDLERLAAEVPAGRTLIYHPNWRAYGYDENYPEYGARPGAGAWIKQAQALGFRVMLHFNFAGINPYHPLRARYDRFLLRDRWTGARVGWYLDRPHDRAHQIMVLNTAFPQARQLLVARLAAAWRELGFDALHLDYPVLINSTQGRWQGRNALGGAELYLQQLQAALPQVAIGTEGIHELLLPCSFAQVGEVFWNPGEHLGTYHPVRSFLFSPYVHLYGHLGMADPATALPAYVEMMAVGLKLASLPTLPISTAGPALPWEAVGVQLALKLGKLWAGYRLLPDFDLRPGEAMAWRGPGGERLALRREAQGWVLRGPGARPVLLVAQGANRLPTPWMVPGWPAQDGEGVFGLDSERRYLALPGAPSLPAVALARPAQPLVLRGYYGGERRVVVEVGAWAPAAWRAEAGMGEVRQLMLVGGKLQPLGQGGCFSWAAAACQGVSKPGIFAHPPWHGAASGGATVGQFRVALPRSPRLMLHFATGLADVVHDPKLADTGDGVTFIISVNGERLFSRHQARDRGWQEAVVDLSRFAGQTVTLRLITAPGPAGSPAFDWAYWSETEIRAEGNPGGGLDLVSSQPAMVTIPAAEASGRGPYRYHFPGAERGWAALLFACEQVSLPARLADLPFSPATTNDGQGEDRSVYGSGTIGQVKMGELELRAINGHTPLAGQTRLDWALALPAPSCRLRLHYGVRPGGESVNFAVVVNGEQLWGQAVPRPVGWQEAVVDLGRWAGQRVLLSLVTDADGSNNCDWAQWGEPVLEVR